MLGNKTTMQPSSPLKHELDKNGASHSLDTEVFPPKKKLRFSLTRSSINIDDHAEDREDEEENTAYPENEEGGSPIRRSSRRAKENAQKRLVRQSSRKTYNNDNSDDDDDDGYAAASDRPGDEYEGSSHGRTHRSRQSMQKRSSHLYTTDDPESSPVVSRVVDKSSSYGRRMRRPVSYREDSFFERIWDEADVDDRGNSSRRLSSSSRPRSRSSGRHASSSSHGLRKSHHQSNGLQRQNNAPVDPASDLDEDLGDFDMDSSFRWSRSRLRQKPSATNGSSLRDHRYSTRGRQAEKEPTVPFRRTTRNSLQALQDTLDEEILAAHEGGDDEGDVHDHEEDLQQQVQDHDEDRSHRSSSSRSDRRDSQHKDTGAEHDDVEEELNGFEVAGKVLRNRRPDSGGVSRPRERSSKRYLPERQLRDRKPVNYAGQIMPRNFEKMLEVQAERDREKMILSSKSFFSHIGSFQRGSGSASFSSRGGGDSGRNRLNEDEDDGTIQLPQGRIFALFGGIQHMKGATIPVNMAEILEAEEKLLMKGVDDSLKQLFESRKLSVARGSTQSIGKPVDFSMVAGHDDHIRSLKEMVGLPLMYPEVFDKFGITPPRGVLFHGPPGTGKTLMARALASTCSTPTRPVAFFMRKGADILSKWVGESERQLRLLFEQAKAWQPSIIFFDEIDGLAPVRSSKQDQIHSSVVSTLLALMDGLDSRGQVVVIGATNRIDSIDPALRRPGRFDREFFFGLPETNARRKIIANTTAHWVPGLDDHVKDVLAEMTQGFNGADMKAMCTEAALHALRRTYPNIYDAQKKISIQVDNIRVHLSDFLAVLKRMVSSTERASTVYGKPLPTHLRTLFQTHIPVLTLFLDQVIPVLKEPKIRGGSLRKTSVIDAENTTTNNNHNAVVIPSSAQERVWTHDYLRAVEPRLLICGELGMGQDLIGSDVLSQLESTKFYIQTLDVSVLSSLVDISAESMILQAFHELKRHRPSVLYLPQVDRWWSPSFPETTRSTLEALLLRERHDPPLIIATCSTPFSDLPEEMVSLFSRDARHSEGIQPHYQVPWKRIVSLSYPDDLSRRSFFLLLLSDLDKSPLQFQASSVTPFLPSPMIPVSDVNLTSNLENTNTAHNAEKDDDIEEPKSHDFTEEELIGIWKEYDKTKRFLRSYFGSIVDDLKKAFRVFARPVDRDLNPEYNPEIPMDLSTMDDKIQKDIYETPDDFLADISIIVANAEEFNDPIIPSQKENLVKARKLQDAAIERVQAIPPDVVHSAWTFFVFSRSVTFKTLMQRQQHASHDFSSLGPVSNNRGGRRRRGRRGGQFIGRTDNPEEINEDPIEVDENDDDKEEIKVQETCVPVDENCMEMESSSLQEREAVNISAELEISESVGPSSHPSIPDVIQSRDEEQVRIEVMESATELHEAVHIADTQNPEISNTDPVESQADNGDLIPLRQVANPVDDAMLKNFVEILVSKTSGLSVHQLEDVGAILASTLLMHRNEWDRQIVLYKLMDSFEHYFATNSGL